MASLPENDELLASLLHGEADPSCLEEIARRAQGDVEFAALVGEELRWSEWIRQALGGVALDPRRSAERFEEALSAERADLEALAASAVDGRLGHAGSERLARALLDDPDRIAELRRSLAFDECLRQAVAPHKSEVAFLESLETRMWAETRRDHFVEAFEERLEAELQAHDPVEGVVEMPRVRDNGVFWRMGAVAAAVALGAFVFVQQLAMRWEDSAFQGDALAFATAVKSTRDVRWLGEMRPDEAGRFREGRYHLERGVVALRFPSGGEMTVEGPAVFEVNGPDSAFVSHGVALARASSAENGIAISSRGMDFPEPLPLIGIDARSEHSTGVVVFDGDGGVCLPDGGCRVLNPRDSVRSDLTRDKLVDVPYNPQPFARGWELLAGVECNLGPVRIELPGSRADDLAREPSESPREGEVRVFVERESFATESPLEVEQIRPGHFASVGSNPGQSLQARGELRSYLLQLWPAEGEMEASLTFDHEVVGIIFTSDRLADSSSMLGTAYVPVPAGGRVGDGVAHGAGGNEILLSDDRRTLSLRVRPGEAPVDQVRVLVALR